MVFGALLLVSSTFINPISASASRYSPPLVVDAKFQGQPVTVFPGGIVNPNFLPPQAGGKVLITNSPLAAPPFPALKIASSVQGESSRAPPYEQFLVSVQNFLFGSSVSVTTSSSAEQGGAVAIQGPALKESQGFFMKTGGDIISSSSPEFSGIAISSGSFQVVVIGNPANSSLQQYSSSTVPFASVTSAIPGLWLDSSKRRSRSQIYVEILELMKRGPMTPFEIAFYARLNHKRTKDYAEFLKRSGYLETVVEDGRLTYVLTKNGIVFLDGVKALFESNRATEYVNF